MASSSIPVKEPEGENIALPNWLELPPEITANILQRLGTVEIVTNACQVCPLWRNNIFKDPLIWRTIHMTNISYLQLCLMDFPKICRYAVEQSCGYLEDIDIELFGSDNLLEFIADNASNLGCMRLTDCSKISDKGFIVAVRKLPMLNKVVISFCKLSKDSLEILGRSRPLLKSLKFSKMRNYLIGSNDDEAFVIANTMFGLCHLDIKGNELADVGLLAILDGCPFLESLDIQECYMLTLNESLKKRCIEQIKDLQLPTLINNEHNYYYDKASYSIFDDDYFRHQDSVVEYYLEDYLDYFYV